MLSLFRSTLPKTMRRSIPIQQTNQDQYGLNHRRAAMKAKQMRTINELISPLDTNADRNMSGIKDTSQKRMSCTFSTLNGIFFVAA